MHHSQGRTTLATLLDTSPANLFTVTAAGSLGLDVLISASLKTKFGTYNFTTPTQQPEVTVIDSNLFTAQPVVTYSNFGTLLNFHGNLSAASLLLAVSTTLRRPWPVRDFARVHHADPVYTGPDSGEPGQRRVRVRQPVKRPRHPIGRAGVQQRAARTGAARQPTSTQPISFNFVPNFQTGSGTRFRSRLTFNFKQSVGGSTTGVITGNNLDPVIDDSTLLSDLNGGTGVQFSTTGGPDLNISLSNGTIFPVIFQNPKTVGDVITQIDEAPGNNGQLVAGINADGDGLVLTDLTLGSNLFNVIGQQELGAGLGLVGIGFNNPTFDPSTPLSHLNNGAGVSFSTTGGDDLMVTLSNGTKLPIKFSNPQTVGDLISQVAAQGNNGQLTLGFNAAGTGLALYDWTGGTGSLSVQAVAGSNALAGLGLTGSAAAGAAFTSTTPLTQLNGGQGVAFATTARPTSPSPLPTAPRSTSRLPTP